MKHNEVLQIRIEPALQARLQLLRDKHHVNVSAWLRRVITAELDREFPPSISESLVDQLLKVPDAGRPAQGRLSRWASRLGDAAPSWLRFRKETS